MALIYKVFLNGLNLNGNVYSLSTNYWMFDKTKISLIYSFFAYLCIICFCLANRPVCWLSCAGVHRSFPAGCASFWDRRLLGSLLWADEDADEDLPTSLQHQHPALSVLHRPHRLVIYGNTHFLHIAHLKL